MIVAEGPPLHLRPGRRPGAIRTMAGVPSATWRPIAPDGLT